MHGLIVALEWLVAAAAGYIIICGTLIVLFVALVLFVVWTSSRW